MVDITIDPTLVIAGANAQMVDAIAGAAVAAGKLVYKDATTKQLKLVDSNAVDPTSHRPLGIALNGAAIGQPVRVQTGGDVTLGAVLVAGDAYYASDTPGGICPRADVGVTEEVVQIGLAKSTSVLAFNISAPGVTL